MENTLSCTFDNGQKKTARFAAGEKEVENRSVGADTPMPSGKLGFQSEKQILGRSRPRPDIRREGVTVKKFFMAALTAATFAIGAPTASAQDLECPEHAHAEHSVLMCTAANTPACVDICVCDRGYSPRSDGEFLSAQNPCVRNPLPPLGSHSRPLAAFGAVRNGRRFSCPDGLGARRVISSVESVSRAFAEQMLEAGQLEEVAGRLPRRVFIRVCHDPLAAHGAPGSILNLEIEVFDQRTRILCGSVDDASDEQVIEDCRATRVLIESIRNIQSGGGPITIHYQDRDWPLQELWDDVLLYKFNELVGRLHEIEQWRRSEVDPSLEALCQPRDDEPLPEACSRFRGEALAHTPAAPHVEDGANSVTMSVGAFGRAGIHTGGPVTVAGGMSLALYFRPDSAPLDIYVRVDVGGQWTDGGVSDSPYVGAAAGVSVYLGRSRRDTMLQMGLWGENLWDPASDPRGDLPADSLGWSAGVELAFSIPLHPYFRLRPGASISFAERRLLENGHLVVLSGAEIQGFIALEGLLPSF